MNGVALRVTIGLLAVALLVGGFFTVFERKERDEYIPPSGQAASNRFFALEQWLTHAGKKVAHGSTVPSDTARYAYLVIGGPLSSMDDATAEDLADWVDDGGILVVQAGTERDMKGSSLWKAFADDGVASAPPGCIDVAGQAGEKALTMCGPRVVPTGDGESATLGDAKGAVFVDRTYGDGRLIVMSTLAPLMRRGLESPVAQRLAFRVFDMGNPEAGVFLIPRLDGPTLWSRLVGQGWPALLAATLLLVAWASGRAPRFGPLVEARPLDRRALLEHVQAAGEFLYARDRGRGLHRRLCAGLLARVRRQDPGAEDLEGEALYARLAERYRLAPAQLARAFETPADAQAFRDSIAILARLRRLP